VVKRIKTIGDTAQKENPKTKKMEDIPSFNLELFNRLLENNPNLDLDMQFTGNTADYTNIFEKECNFASMAEMEAARELLTIVKKYDDADTDYVVFNSPFTYTVGVFTDTDVELIRFPDLKSYNFMIDIMKWITYQETLF
jgi:hypothetical protein